MFIVIYFLLQILDVVITQLALDTGMARELNPFYNFYLILFLKLALGIFIIRTKRIVSKKTFTGVMLVVDTFMLFVVINNIYVFVKICNLIY